MLTAHSPPEGFADQAWQATPARSCRVLLCGPIADPGRPAAGGYEAANRRTADALARHGVAVVEMPYPKFESGSFRKLLSYTSMFTRGAAFIAFRRGRYDLLHLTPLNMHFAWAEMLLLSCAKWAGKPALLDVRAGTFVRHYGGKGSFYRGVVDRSLRLADRVTVEGRDYLSFVRGRTRSPVSYFPNYVDAAALRMALPARALQAASVIRLVYFGRIVPEKGIETALQTLAMLRSQGRPAALTLIGTGPLSYVAGLRERHDDPAVTWLDGLPLTAVLEHAASCHFFVFASRHDGEGHSNALNEAMAVGLVPICTDSGFSRDVVANTGVVLPRDATAEQYAAAITDIVDRGDWAKLSYRARSRIQALFSEQVAVPRLVGIYRSMLESKG